MTKAETTRLRERIEAVRDGNAASARDAALKFVLTNDGAEQRKALVDSATADAYSSVLIEIESILNPEDKNG